MYFVQHSFTNANCDITSTDKDGNCFLFVFWLFCLIPTTPIYNSSTLKEIASEINCTRYIKYLQYCGNENVQLIYWFSLGMEREEKLLPFSKKNFRRQNEVDDGDAIELCEKFSRKYFRSLSTYATLST